MSRSRWTNDPSVPRGATYDDRFAQLEAAGTDVHGEASLIAQLSPGPLVLDAGCGTGRVAIELDRRGLAPAGVDLDPAMLASARTKAPHLEWHEADLTTFELPGRSFDTVALAGNVLIFVAPGTEHAVIGRCAALVAANGILVSGFQVRRRRFGPAELDKAAADHGLSLVHRWSTWDRAPWPGDGTYQVSVHGFAPPHEVAPLALGRPREE